MTEEVSSKDWFLNISNDENPGKGSTQTKVEGERTLPVCVYRNVIYSHEGESIRRMCAFRERGRYSTNFRTSIYKKTCVFLSVT